MTVQDDAQICFHEDENIMTHKEISIKRETPRTQSTAALQVLVGLVSGLVCDRKLDDKEIQYLKDWLEENISMNEVYPINIYIRNIEAILEDEAVSTDEREQFLRFLEKQANFDNRLYVPIEHIETLTKALRLAHEGKWQESLVAVSAKSLEKNSAACWIVATLYKQLGDEANSRYKYRFTSIKYEDYANTKDELKAIIERLGFDLSVAMLSKEPVC